MGLLSLSRKTAPATEDAGSGHQRVNERRTLEERFTIRLGEGGERRAEIHVSATDRKVKTLRLELPGDNYGRHRQTLDLMALPDGVTLEKIAAAIRTELVDYIWND